MICPNQSSFMCYEYIQLAFKVQYNPTKFSISSIAEQLNKYKTNPKYDKLFNVFFTWTIYSTCFKFVHSTYMIIVCTKIKYEFRYCQDNNLPLMTFDNIEELQEIRDMYIESKPILRIITDDVDPSIKVIYFNISGY